MAHFAEVNEQNVVTRVLVTDNNSPENDEGYSWLIKTYGGTWIQTSYNTMGGVHLLGGQPFRKNFAGIGFTYDLERDAFIPPKPFDSWVLDETTCLWEAPIAMPDDEKKYQWNEDSQSWLEIRGE